MKVKRMKVAVGMSGGVDSSTAVALLQENGHEVIGVTIVTHEGGLAETAALEAAEQLRIPLHVLDFRTVFKQEVIDSFAESYYRGETPNPCVLCNRKIKFGELLKQSRRLGADYLATGHYVRKMVDETSGRWLIQTGLDAKKDQSYVLYSLSQEQIAHALFPLGDYTKEQVRDLARNRKLTAADSSESQEICFIPDDNYAEYIRAAMGKDSEPGDFTDFSGRIIGRHRGLIHYTVGQRKGLGVTFGKPMFVASIDPVGNRVILGEGNDLYTDILWATGLNWIALERLSGPLKVQAKIRYKANPAAAVLYPENNLVRVQFETPQRAVTPGQSVVFYDGPTVLGGGVIVSDKCGIRQDLLKAE